jgi:hypothetical protein
MNSLMTRIHRLCGMCFGVAYPKIEVMTNGGGLTSPWYATIELPSAPDIRAVGASHEAALEALLALLVERLADKREQTQALLNSIDSALVGERTNIRKDGPA